MTRRIIALIMVVLTAMTVAPAGAQDSEDAGIATRAREAMSLLKFHPRDALPNTTALSRAEALFVELRGPDREELGLAMRAFRLSLEDQDPKEIEASRRKLLLLVDRLRRRS